MRKVISVLTIAIFLGFAPLAISAQVQTNQVQGEVLRIDGNTLTVRDEQGSTQQITVDENILLRRNTLEAQVSDLQPGDDVTIVQAEDGQILSVNATAGEVIDWGRWLVPLAIGAVVLLGLVWWTVKKSNQPHVKTATQ